MPAAAKWAMGILAGGLTLGALLGQAAHPDMKDAPPPWWQLTGRSATAAPDRDRLDEAAPVYASSPAGYRPDLDYDAEVWALPIPAYELAALSEPLAPIELEVPGPELPAPDAAGEDADAAMAQSPGAAAAGPAETRKSALARSGLY